MRKLLSVAAAVAAIFTMTGAHAAKIAIDDFNSPPQTVFDVSYEDVGPQVGVTSVVGATPGQAPGGRSLTHTLLTNTAATVGDLNDNVGGSVSKALVGTAAFPQGTLAMSNVGGVTSQVDLKWTLASSITSAIDLSQPLSFYFDVVVSDTVKKFISYSLTGLAGSYISLTPAGYNQEVDIGCSFPCTAGPVAFNVNLSAAQASDIKNTSDLYLRITGDNGWDFVIDSIGLATPEPTSLALVGLALVGAGVVARRRKA